MLTTNFEQFNDLPLHEQQEQLTRNGIKINQRFEGGRLIIISMLNGFCVEEQYCIENLELKELKTLLMI